MTNQTAAPATMHELLGTKNKKEQARRVGLMMEQINMPVIDLVIRYDGRTGQMNISVIGPDVQIDNLYRILDGARGMLRERELEAMKTRENQEQPGNALPTMPIPTEEDHARARNIR